LLLAYQNNMKIHKKYKIKLINFFKKILLKYKNKQRYNNIVIGSKYRRHMPIRTFKEKLSLNM
jgi:hypothetical protein